MAGGRIDIEIAPDFDAFPGKLGAGLRQQGNLASSLGRGLGLAIAGGTAIAAVGLKNVIDLGNEYTGNLNELQAVTQATGVQMAKVGELAKDLGADMSLPATSAADAAAAMKELAKGGLDLDEAMTAAKGTLQLAAAAQVDAARAAEIQSDALNQFGLSAENAAHVADVLANTANAASGEVTDIANALKYVGPVAKTVGADIDSVATAIGLIATQGIRGEQAGTSLRGMIASLASPSAPAARALETLAINAFTAEGKFVGLRAITEQLASAKGRLTEAEFTTAAAVAFGNEGMTVASALASTGAKAFDDMAVSVGRAGGAADVAAAKTRGLKGAWEGLKSQAETTGIEIFEAIDGPLERLVRAAADQTAEIGESVVHGLETAIAAGETFGPRLAEAIRSRASVVAQAGQGIVTPLVAGAVNPLNEALNTSLDLWDDFTGVLDNAVEGATSAAQGIGRLAAASADGDGPVSALGAGLSLVGDVGQAASIILVPLGKAVGLLADFFAELPGPVQSAVLALGLVAAFRTPLANLGQTVRDRVTAPFVHFNETLRLQQALLTGSTGIASAQVSNLGLAMGALEARVPVIGRMADSFRSASTAAQGFVTQQAALAQTAAGISGQYTGAAAVLGRMEGTLRGVAGAAAGTTAALGTGLRAAAGGLVSVLGGPFGVAMAGAAIGLSLLADRQQEAAQKAAAHAASANGLAAALRESNGRITEQIRLSVAQRFLGDEFKEAAEAAKLFNIAVGDVSNAALDQGAALDALRSRLQGIIDTNRVVSEGDLMGGAGTATELNETGQAAQKLLDALNNLAGGTDDAKEQSRQLDEAIRNGRASMLDASDSGRSLARAMGVLSDNTASADDRARALKDALDALSGGSVNLEAAQARVNERLDRLSDVFRTNGSEAEIAARNAKGFGDALLKTDGSINTTTENGRRLFDGLQDLSESMAETAQKTFDLARSQGDDIPTAMAKATAAAQGVRDGFIGTHDQMGLNITQATALADRYGLLPSQVATLITSPGMSETQQELIILKSLVDKVPPDKPITVRSLSDEAKAKLIDLGFTVTTTPNNVTITANSDKAREELDEYLDEPATKVVNIVANVSREAKDFGVGGYAAGGIAIKQFAAGGFHRLTPMSAGVASIVPPNTWRVIGDRMRDDEAYIPINREMRSQAILAQTASRMGFDLIRRFATGGIAAGGGSTTVSVQAPSMPSTLTIVDSEGAFLGRMQLVAEKVVDRAAREIQLRGRS